MSQENRKEWLEEAILEHIQNNPMKDSVDITLYFGLSADIIMESLNNLEKDDKIKRLHKSGLKYGYRIVEDTIDFYRNVVNSIKSDAPRTFNMECINSYYKASNYYYYENKLEKLTTTT